MAENTNCLEGIRCPACGQNDLFYVMGTAVFPITDEGTDCPVGDIEYDDSASMTCAACHHTDQLSAFKER